MPMSSVLSINRRISFPKPSIQLVMVISSTRFTCNSGLGPVSLS
jgi:hypothetical protein